MFPFIKSKEYSTAYSHLKHTGFLDSDFGSFHIKQIVNEIIDDQSLLVPLTEIIQEVKLDQLRVLKIQLLVHQLLQVEENMQESQLLLQLLLVIGRKIKHIMESSISLSASVGRDRQQSLTSSKDLRNSPYQNQSTLLVKKIIEPLLQLQKRLIFCYDLVYPPPEASELELSDCWAVLNLLKKFVEIGPQIQAIGRYYSKKNATAMIFLIKVMDVDIQLLYQRIKTFVLKKIGQYEGLQNLGRVKSMQNEQRVRMKQFMELIEQVQAVNEHIKHFYVNKYLISDLLSNNIRMPSLFTTESYLDLLYHLERNVLRKGNSQCSSLSKSTKICAEEVEEL